MKNKFSGKLAIYCSDERFVKATSVYLNKSLGVKRCDLLVVPGGAVFIVNKEKSLVDRLRLLVEAHKISSIILFAHVDCGYYKDRYKNSSSNVLMKKQVEDIKKCQLQLNKMFPQVVVKSFYVGVKEVTPV